jgi:hypothetical protein
MAGRERNDIEIRDDEEGPGAIVSFPFDAAVAERFREAFPRARWSDQLGAWQRREEAKSAPEYEETKAAAAERRRRRYPVPASELPPPDRVLMSHEGPLVFLEVTGEVVPAETAARHYPWSSGQPGDLVWALWRRPAHEELVKT